VPGELAIPIRTKRDRRHSPRSRARGGGPASVPFCRQSGRRRFSGSVADATSGVEMGVLPDGWSAPSSLAPLGAERSHVSWLASPHGDSSDHPCFHVRHVGSRRRSGRHTPDGGAECSDVRITLRLGQCGLGPAHFNQPHPAIADCPLPPARGPYVRTPECSDPIPAAPWPEPSLAMLPDSFSSPRTSRIVLSLTPGRARRSSAIVNLGAAFGRTFDRGLGPAWFHPRYRRQSAPRFDRRPRP
jgi:hypothetical protein